jgi:FlaA1/EpsC-like NDP-sugar epimerase
MMLSNTLVRAAARQLLSPAWQQRAAYATGGSSGSSNAQGPVTLVFGATGGIGAALSRGLAGASGAQSPAAVVLSGDGADKLKALQQELSGVETIPADACDPASVR